MLEGVRASFDALPLLTVGIDQNLFDMLVRLLHGSPMNDGHLSSAVGYPGRGR